jgi:pimeloyl-ACP methyl ester carboxylesterase
MSRIAFAQIGSLDAPWTDAAQPSAGGPFPVVVYLPGVTGYMQMGSFQTSGLAAQGFVVVTVDQPGTVAAATMPDHQIIVGLTRETAASLIAPSYRHTGEPLPGDFASDLLPEHSIVPYFAADVPLVLDRLAEINADPAHPLHGMLDLHHIGLMGMSLGAIVTAQACALDARIGACLMMDAPVPTDVARVGLRQPALWITRPKADQRRERAASGGWSETEIDAQAATIDLAMSNSGHGQLVQLQGLFHIDFTDLPAIQPALGWLGQSGPAGFAEAHRQINELTKTFFAKTIGTGGG